MIFLLLISLVPSFPVWAERFPEPEILNVAEMVKNLEPIIRAKPATKVPEALVPEEISVLGQDPEEISIPPYVPQAVALTHQPAESEPRGDRCTERLAAATALLYVPAHDLSDTLVSIGTRTP